jgi:hypothetical protein
MKKQTTCLLAAGIALAAALILTGCPPEAGDPVIDAKLVHKWADGGNPDSYLKRNFEIRSDAAFTANLDPVALGAYAQAGGPSDDAATEAIAQAAAKFAVDQLKAASLETSWQVSGKLIHVEGDIYKMDELKARDTDVQIVPSADQSTPPSSISANLVLPNFKENVNIVLSADGNSFTLSPAGTDEIAGQIQTFFGGTYNRVAE